MKAMDVFGNFDVQYELNLRSSRRISVPHFAFTFYEHVPQSDKAWSIFQCDLFCGDFDCSQPRSGQTFSLQDFSDTQSKVYCFSLLYIAFYYLDYSSFYDSTTGPKVNSWHRVLGALLFQLIKRSLNQ